MTPYAADHRTRMLKFLERDKADARRHKFILGFQVRARGDEWPCPRADTLAGLYLVDELPDLYPADCPSELAHIGCACVLREFVLVIDDNAAAQLLKKRASQFNVDRT
jgi:hypothetical protein